MQEISIRTFFTETSFITESERINDFLTSGIVSTLASGTVILFPCDEMKHDVELSTREYIVLH